jgi:Na+(H+)/acetate symporter ActP
LDRRLCFTALLAPTFENLENLLFLILLENAIQTVREQLLLFVLLVSFTYVAGQMRGVGLVFSKFLEVDINTG